MSYNQQIINYYDSSQWVYSIFVYNSKSLGMHFGFWDEHTKNMQQAIINQHQAIIDYGQIKPQHQVLDAGCGVGGTSFYVAKHTQAQVTGITLSLKQVNIAQNQAQKNNLSHLTKFHTQDFTQTSFSNQYFDVIFGNESICYASPKSSFLNEAYRLLKPKGKRWI